MGPALPDTRRRLRAAIAATAAAVVAAGATAFTMMTAEAATTGCEVDYQITAQWPGGFNANVEITNLGDTALDPWKLEWDFPGTQKVANAWNTTATQSGAHVTAAGVDYNKRLAAASTASFGFTGTANAAPDSFKLNGAECTGDSGPVPTNPSTNVTASPTEVPTGGPGQEEWNPPSNLVQPLNEVWAHVEDTYNLDFRNFGWDQVMATGGTINYCVRWDSENSVSLQTRDAIEAKLQQQYNLWFDQMEGWNEWPFDRIDVIYRT